MVYQEITGSSVLQPNSPQSIIQTALESANRSRLLARRLFYSFAKPNADFLLVEDIARFFSTAEEAESVFALFDQDSNGDASRDEVEMSIMYAAAFNVYLHISIINFSGNSIANSSRLSIPCKILTAR